MVTSYHRPWQSVCASSECVEWREQGHGLFEIRAKGDPGDTVMLTLAEIGQLSQAYLDGEFGPVKVSRL